MLACAPLGFARRQKTRKKIKKKNIHHLNYKAFFVDGVVRTDANQKIVT
jgi:hypothetical protein